MASASAIKFVETSTGASVTVAGTAIAVTAAKSPFIPSSEHPRIAYMVRSPKKINEPMVTIVSIKRSSLSLSFFISYFPYLDSKQEIYLVHLSVNVFAASRPPKPKAIAAATATEPRVSANAKLTI